MVSEPVAPQRKWIMKLDWEDLLFMNWRIPADVLRPLIPPALTIDEADGSAWISVVPFFMTNARFRRLPPLPFISRFPQVNLRTYVSAGGHAGVWFISLDSDNRLNVFIARRGFHMPYFFADVVMERGGEIAFRSARKDGAAAVDLTYRGEDEEFEPRAGSLEDFLTERYSSFGISRGGGLYRVDIRHSPWRLRAADVEVRAMDLPRAMGVDVGKAEPLTFMSPSSEVTLWPPVRA